MIWHKADKTNISKEEFDKKLNDILLNEKWIIDGNYQRTIEVRLQECDAVFLLDYPLDVCLTGAKSRVGKNVRICLGLKRSLTMSSGSL